jgi:hypothetical protein
MSDQFDPVRPGRAREQKKRPLAEGVGPAMLSPEELLNWKDDSRCAGDGQSETDVRQTGGG